jgi:hypothetical protein
MAVVVVLGIPVQVAMQAAVVLVHTLVVQLDTEPIDRINTQVVSVAAAAVEI